MQRLKNSDKIVSVKIVNRFDVKDRYTYLAYKEGETYYKKYLFGLIKFKRTAKHDLYYDEVIDMREWNVKPRHILYIIDYWWEHGLNFESTHEIHPTTREVYEKPNITIKFTDGKTINKYFDTNEGLEQWWNYVCESCGIDTNKFISY